MNDDLEEIMNFRALILNNADSLHKYGVAAKKDRQQMSLFGGENEVQVKLEPPGEVNIERLLEAEKDALGVYMTHNPFENYVLVGKKYANHTIDSLQYLTKDSENGLIVLARVNEIKLKKSQAGNDYAKLIIGDAVSTSCTVYLWGKKYKELIPSIFTNTIYLIEFGYKKEGDTLFVVNMRKAIDVPIERLVKKITLYIGDVQDIPKVRSYVFANMIGDSYSLAYCFNGEMFEPTYRVNFTGENFRYLKNFITDIGV